MTLYYSKSTGGFYDSSIHGEKTLTIDDPKWQRPTKSVSLAVGQTLQVDGKTYTNDTQEAKTVTVPDMSAVPEQIETKNTETLVPDDAVVISQELHQQLLAGQAEGKLIQADATGKPELADQPEPSDSEKKALKAAEVRAKRDAIVERVTREINRIEDKGKKAKLWRKYRQTLRDLPAQDGFPFSVTWPDAPAGYTGR